MSHNSRRIWTAWIAILAIVLNALMPAIAQAVTVGPTVKAGAWTEVCSVQGTSWLRSDANGHVLEQSSKKPAQSPQEVAHFSKCLYCLTHAGSFALAPPEVGGVLPGSTALGSIQSTANFFLPSHLFWAVPALRAPPLV